MKTRRMRFVLAILLSLLLGASPVFAEPTDAIVFSAEEAAPAELDEVDIYNDGIWEGEEEDGFAVEALPIDINEEITGEEQTEPVMAVMAAASDSESSLKSMLKGKIGGGTIDKFFYHDYDGNGTHEAFAYVKKKKGYDDGSSNGDIWYVNKNGAKKLQSGKDYWENEFAAPGKAPKKLFTAGEYRTTTSKLHIWMVKKGEPVYINVTASDIRGGDSDTPLFCTVDAYDGWTDGTGHTWKSYFFYIDGTSLREYGGIWITKSQFLKFKNAKNILKKYTPSGSSLDSIIYRSNHIINLNFSEGGYLGSNHYVTVKYHSGKVEFWENGEGNYKTASNPSIAVYPNAFVAPSDGTPELAAKSVKLGKGETYKLASSKKGYTFKTSDSKVATISKGVITAKGVGTAKITVKAKNGKKATCKVTVKKAPTKVTLNKKKLSLKVGKYYRLTASVPKGTYASKFTWSSSDAKVAKVSVNGKVTAVKAGTATITVKTLNGKKTTCKVTVKAPKKRLELSNYMGLKFYQVAEKLGFEWTNNKVSYGGTLGSDCVDYMQIKKDPKKEYSLCGLYLGMKLSEVEKYLLSHGWEGNGYTYTLEADNHHWDLNISYGNGVVTNLEAYRWY